MKTTFPEFNSTKNKSPVRRKVLRVVGAIAIVAASVGLGVAGEAKFSNKVSTEQVRDEAAKAALEQVIAKDSAENLALTYAQALNNGQMQAGIRVLNGEIEAINKIGQFKPMYKNPILLATVKPAADSKIDAESIDNGWVGYEYYSEGKIVILPVPVDGIYTRFVPYDNENLILPNVGVYASEVSKGNNIQSKVLFAYDLEGEKVLQNPDGTPVQPGLIID